MKIINFSHPLTDKQLQQIEKISGQKVEEVIEIASKIEPDRPLAAQIEKMLAEANLTAKEWQSLPLLINLPALNYSAAVMLAQLHGRMGYFPTILRLRPIPGKIPPGFELAEILNLQALRDKARSER